MRQIKFRGKRIDNGEWVYGYLIQDRYIVGNVIDFEEDYFTTEFWAKVDPDTVGQFTGMKDKNGAEIYTGDIIEGGYLNPMTSYFLSKKYIVDFANCHYSGILIRHTPYGDTWLEFIEGVIIGNIWDNPELIGGLNAKHR